MIHKILPRIVKHHYQKFYTDYTSMKKGGYNTVTRKNLNEKFLSLAKDIHNFLEEKSFTERSEGTRYYEHPNLSTASVIIRNLRMDVHLDSTSLPMLNFLYTRFRCLNVEGNLETRISISPSPILRSRIIVHKKK